MDAQVGSVWQFTVADHVNERGRDHFQLENSEEPIEVLDLRAITDETALQSNLTGGGIRLSPPPLAKRVLLWMASGVCVGPLFLKPGATQGLWMLDTPEAHRDASRMPIWRPSANDINRVTIDRDRFFVSPRLELGQAAGVQNWASDAQVARSILTRLRKMEPEVAKAVVESDRVFREYLERIEAGRLGGGDPDVERARSDRLRGLRLAIQRDVDLLREAADALLNTPAVRVEIERGVEQRVQEEVKARQDDIEQELSGKTERLSQASERLAKVEEQLDAKQTEIQALDGALSEKRQELETTVAAFDRALSTKLEEVAQRPEAAFADAAFMRALLAPGLVRASAGEFEGVHLKPPTYEFEQGGRQLADEATIRGALVAHAGGEQLSLHAMLGLHATFISGAIPVVVGTRNYDLLRAYAFAIAGGRLHWIPVGSSAMEPQDLLGRYDGRSGRISPSAYGLLDVVRDATQSGRLHVVVLEGFNRAPSETYLSPILEVVRAGRVGDIARAIPIAFPGTVAMDDPYRDLARLTWPSSVLIACIPTDGSATLPVPSSVWRYLALLDAEDRDRRPALIPPGNNGAPEITEISPTVWAAILKKVSSHLPSDHDTTETLGSTLSLSSRDVEDAARLRDVLRTIGLPAHDAIGAAITSILVARAGVDGKKIEDAIRASGAAVAGWQTVVAEAQQLRS